MKGRFKIQGITGSHMIVTVANIEELMSKIQFFFREDEVDLSYDTGIVSHRGDKLGTVQAMLPGQPFMKGAR